MNSILLRGTVIETASFSHDSHGQIYYQMILSTTRLSGAEDTLRVLVPEPLLHGFRPLARESVEMEGTLRSFNNKSGQGSRLVLSALAKSIRPTEEPSINQVELSGALCKNPIYRRTPLGREICDLIVAVPRPYGRADYLPIITWGVCARACSGLAVGGAILVEGRFQSRKYIKIIGEESVEKTAYEISATRVELLESEEESQEA